MLSKAILGYVKRVQKIIGIVLQEKSGGNMATTKVKLLTQNDRELCEKIAELNIVLVSRRARALLMLDDGHTQAKSAQLSSLTVGQLRYLLILFKKKGTNLFPQELKETFSAEPAVADSNPGEAAAKEKTKKTKKKKTGKKSSAKKKKKNKKEGKKKKEKKSKKKKSSKGKKKKP